MSNNKAMQHYLPNNYQNYQMYAKNVDNIDQNKKAKNLFRSGKNLTKKKQIIYHTPNLGHSFLNASAPFNYYKNSYDQNSFLVCFNGGPKMTVYLPKNPDDANNKEVVYSNVRKPCGCLYKSYVTKLNRSISPLNKYKYNMDNTNIYKEKMKYYIKINNRSKNKMPQAVNLKKYSGLINNKPFREKSASILSNYNREALNNNIRYNYDSAYEEEINKSKRDQSFRKSCTNFRPKLDKTFHKTQIFDHCKPYLVDQFQEFPD